MAKNNGKVRRLIAQILFSEGPMTRARVCERLHELGMFREVPSESSLAALISKNTQVVSVGHTKIELSNGARVNNMVFDVDRELVKEERDLMLTRPYSSMTTVERKCAVRCPECRQMRIIEEKFGSCLICLRRAV